MRRISACFKGENGSYGYITNQTYILEVYSVRQNPKVVIKIKCPPLPNEGVCDYESFTAFMNNWTNIKVI